ncbi:hypothetical protein M0804_000828 [Polistes exclamans]|nr:hypothetical protein M0804_000828 [Polistes exclamans]
MEEKYEVIEERESCIVKGSRLVLLNSAGYVPLEIENKKKKKEEEDKVVVVVVVVKKEKEEEEKKKLEEEEEEEEEKEEGPKKEGEIQRTSLSRRMDSCGIYLSQLRAMLVRNLLLKKREKRKTTAVCSMATKRLRFTVSRSSQVRNDGVLPVAAVRCHFCVRTVPTGPRVEEEKKKKKRRIVYCCSAVSTSSTTTSNSSSSSNSGW